MLDASIVRICLAGAALVTVAMTWVAHSSNRSSSKKTGADQRFRSFQRLYLCVYLTGMMADWLQGPYVYALYESYGFTRTDNALLFTCGFGSSAVFGTFIGALADRLGRRKFATLYCLLYGVSCLTKHVNSFSVLIVGRVTGGVATSLLFSVFDSWMVSEHNRRSFEPELLGGTFSLAVSGNSLVAIVAGELGQIAADYRELKPLAGNVYIWGYCTPFDFAIGFLVLCVFLIMTTWGENYGQKSGGNELPSSATESLVLATKTLMQDPQVLYVGIVCALFESSMFIFVFMWTPALTEEGVQKPPYGHIFATFMVMAMLGSQIFSLESKRRSIESLGRLTLFIAAACNAVPVYSDDENLRFFAFLVFEMCVGLYFPMMGTLKGLIVPEQSRSAIYNLYRVPLNVIVVLSLVSKLELRTAFTVNTVMLVIAGVAQTRLVGLRGNKESDYRPVSTSKAIDFEFGLDDADGTVNTIGAGGYADDGMGGPGSAAAFGGSGGGTAASRPT